MSCHKALRFGLKERVVLDYFLARFKALKGPDIWIKGQQQKLSNITGYSRSSMYWALEYLVDNGYLKRRPGKCRGFTGMSIHEYQLGEMKKGKRYEAY